MQGAPEVIERILDYLAPVDVVNYCSSSPEIWHYCNDMNNKFFWLRKLDADCTVEKRGLGGKIVKTIIPSNYVDANDVGSGYEIYKRFIETHNIEQALVEGNINIATWLFDSGRTRPSSKYIKIFISTDNIEGLVFLSNHGYNIDWYSFETEIIRNGKHNILLYLLNNGIYDMHQIFDQGNIELLDFISQYGFLPNVNDANYAVQLRKLDILQWLENKQILPDNRGTSIAVKNQDITTLYWLIDRGLVPGSNDVNSTIVDNHIEMLKLLLELGIFPDMYGMDRAIENINILKLILSYGMKPSTQAANLAVTHNNIPILLLLLQNGIKPDREGANIVNNIDVVVLLMKWGILPDSQGANKALKRSDTRILSILMQQGIVPTEAGYTEAIRLAPVALFEWLAEQGWMLNEDGANLALQYKRYDILKWLETKGVYPSTR